MKRYEAQYLHYSRFIGCLRTRIIDPLSC